ncbi:MAG: glycoside hydrolase family 32 protein [Kiritimatiellaeota bacterium]|nr:glycoside hydrolase family 32 protein [Kiritimatiellota bacterium]
MTPNDPKTVQELIGCARRLRTKLLADPHRPRYHLCAPEGIALPFDPNGCLYWRGRYHLFYIFQDPNLPRGGHCWGHVSSADLLHWIQHPTALTPAPGDPEIGIFSGNALLNKDGVPTLVYFGVGAGICIATSSDKDLNRWTKHSGNPVIPIPREGEPGHGLYNVHDPHAWLERDTYYVILNGKVLPKKEYDTTFLFRSRDLVHWQYVHQFYRPNPEWTGPEEDCACPDFFKLGERHMLLAISHARGTRYYLGRYENERFHPEEHHRMNWPGGTCFAPESLVDDCGRRIMWAWVLDRRTPEQMHASGWSGTMTLPRRLSLAPDGSLRIEPVDELRGLRTNHRSIEGFQLSGETEIDLPDLRGDCMEIALDLAPGNAAEIGLKVRCSPHREEETVIAYSMANNRLRIDLARSSLDARIVHRTFCIHHGDNPAVTAQEAPFALAPGEPLRWRVFLDRSILEVFANDRQCVTQRLYPTRADSLGVALFCRGNAAVRSLEAWDMAPTNPW